MKRRRQKSHNDPQSISRRKVRSPTLAEDGGTSDLIPVDLIIEILSRMPVKFIARCRCVSKLWGSIICSQEFTELFLTISVTTRPQLLFSCETDREVLFYLSPQPQNPNMNMDFSRVVANYHMSFPLNREDVNSMKILPPVHGLICMKQKRILKGNIDVVLVICNPSTRQSLTLSLPRVKTTKFDGTSFFVYDPIGKQFKLLFMIRPKYGRKTLISEHHILTLGNGNLSWRRIEFNIPHYPLSEGICIDGVLYYQARVKGFEGKFTIACFDVRSEKLKIIEEGDEVVRGKLVNYKGKLAKVRSNNSPVFISVLSRSFHLCILEDAEKHEWSTHKYVLPEFPHNISPRVMNIKGVTRTGEIVLSPYDLSRPFYLIYYNLERNTFINVGIQGLDVHRRKHHTFIDHVEDVKFGGVFETS